MKTVTGHKSDTVFQDYIKTVLMKRKAADAISTSRPNPAPVVVNAQATTGSQAVPSVITINFINSSLMARESFPLVTFAEANFSF